MKTKILTILKKCDPQKAIDIYNRCIDLHFELPNEFKNEKFPSLTSKLYKTKDLDLIFENEKLEDVIQEVMNGSFSLKKEFFRIEKEGIFSYKLNNNINSTLFEYSLELDCEYYIKKWINFIESQKNDSVLKNILNIK